MDFDTLPYEIKRYYIFDQLDSISKICLRHAHMSCFEILPAKVDKQTQKDICKYSYEFFYYFRNYVDYGKILKYCAMNNNYLLLKTLHKAGYIGDIKVCWVAAKNNNIEVLKYAISNGLYWTEDCDTCAFAAEYGHLESLKWLRSNKISWDNQTHRCAAKNGHLEVLKWVVENNGPIHRYSVYNAAQNGHLHIIHYLFIINQSNNILEEACIGAAKGGHLNILKWVRKKRYQWSTSTYNAAASGGHLHILKWLRSNDQYPVPWNEQIYIEALKSGHIDILKWLKSVNAPYDNGITAVAARFKNFDIFNWLLINNYPCNLQRIYDEALYSNNKEILRWFYILTYYCLQIRYAEMSEKK